MSGFQLPKSLDKSLRENLAAIGKQAVTNNRNLSEHTQRAAGIPPHRGVRLIVFQVPSTGQATVMDADKPNRPSVGFERVAAFVAHGLLIDVPLHGRPLIDFDAWKREREAEGTVFNEVQTIF
jgi:hypothetical protein